MKPNFNPGSLAILALFALNDVGAQSNQWLNIHPSGPDNALGGPVNFIKYGFDGTAYLGSRENKLYRRASAGDPWVFVNTTLNGNPVNPANLYFDTSNHQRIVANITRASVSSDGSVIESLDSGATWSVLHDVSQSSATILKGQAPFNSNELVAYMPVYSLNNTPKLARSLDGGLSWVETVMPVDIFGGDYRIDSLDSNTLYTLNAQEFNKSTDGGVSWEAKIAGLGFLWYLNSFDVSVTNPDIVYGGSGAQTSIARSVDGAETWEFLNGIPGSSGTVNALAIDPSSSDRVFFGTQKSGAYRTVDGAVSWQRVDTTTFGSWSHIEISPDGEVIFGGTSGVAIYEEPGLLIPSNIGFNDFPMLQLKFAPSDADYLYASSTGAGLAVKLPGTQNWVLRNGSSLLNSNSPGSFSIDFNNPERIVGYSNGVYASFNGFHLSTDAGLSWAEIGSFLTASGIWFDPVNSQRIFALAGSDFLQTLDNGATWTTLATNVEIQELFINKADSNFMLSYSFGFGLRTSRDGGLTWQPVTESFENIYVPTYPTEITDDPNDPDVLYFTFNELGNFTSSPVWRSDDFGLTWSPLASTHPNIGGPVSIAADPFINGRVYVLDFGGVMKVFEPSSGTWNDLGFVVTEQCGFAYCSIVPDPKEHGRVLVQYSGVLHEIRRDFDSDGHLDSVDNCTYIANSDQRDTDGDLIGNVCDGDLNNDGTVNFIDLSLFASAFLTADQDADFNGDGVVNFIDLPVVQNSFLKSPGPNAAGD